MNIYLCNQAKSQPIQFSEKSPVFALLLVHLVGILSHDLVDFTLEEDPS
jgi:hypothetical protein